MAEEYSKLTVVQIRELFKTRGIPVTGLNRKQQLINRLLEEDAKSAQPVADEATQPSETMNPDSRKADVEPPRTDPAVAQSEPSRPEEQPAPAPEPAPSRIVEEQRPLSTVEPQGNEIIPESQSMPQELEPRVREAKLATSSSPGAASQTPEESRKRKRRSLTPPVTQEDAIALDQQKPAEKSARYTEPMQVNEVTARGTRMNESITNDGSAPAQVDGTPDRQLEDTEMADTKATAAAESAKSPSIEAQKLETEDEPRVRSERYNNFHSNPFYMHSASTHTTNSYIPKPSSDVSSTTYSRAPETSNTPSVHPATSALYISGLKRPLRPDALREHVTHIAQPPSGSPSIELQTFHIDSIRSHCFVILAPSMESSADSVDPAVNAAARARDQLHNSRFPPDETHREPLFVDFVPSSSVPQWIEAERSEDGSRGSRSSGKRWEVVYLKDNNENSIASHQEAKYGPSTLGPRQPSFPTAREPPIVPMDIDKKITKAKRPENERSEAFDALDNLFSRTKSKPQLYYQPVNEEVADKRLEMLRSNYSRNHKDGYRSRPNEAKRRYTFQARHPYEDGSFDKEKEEELVDNGPEFGMLGGIGSSGRGRAGGLRGRGGGPRRDRW